MSARDTSQVQTSDLFIYQDDEMEHFVEDFQQTRGYPVSWVQRQPKALNSSKGDADHEKICEDHDHDLTESGQSEEEHHEEGEEGHHCNLTHTWMDPMTYQAS